MTARSTKEFAGLRLVLALSGISCFRTDPQDGPVNYLRLEEGDHA